MRTIIKSKILFIFLELFLLLISFSTIKADGVMIAPYKDNFDYYLENQQAAYIKHDGNYEDLLISINYDRSDENLVWLLPIPSSPEKINIDNLAFFPVISGNNIKEKTKDNFNTAIDYALSTFYAPIISVKPQNYKKSFNEAALLDNSAEDNQVIVHQEINKHGITTQILTAKNSQAIQNYFENKNFQFNVKNIHYLDQYINQDYSFVISWIQPNSNTNQNFENKAIYIKFPSKNIYYPMKLTSAYGMEQIKVDLRLIGYYDIELPSIYRHQAVVQYYYDDKIYVNQNKNHQLAYNYLLPNRQLDNDNYYHNIRYTKISFNSPAKQYNKDITIPLNTKNPLNLIIVEQFSRHLGIMVILTTVLVHFIAAFISSFIQFGFKHIKLSLLSISSLFSIFTFAAIVYIYKTRNDLAEAKPLLKELKQSGVYKKRKISSFLLIITIYLILIHFILMLGNGPIGYLSLATNMIVKPINYMFNFSTNSYFNLIRIFQSFIFISPIIFLLVIKKLNYINMREKSILKKLKKMGYSRMTLTIKDKRKISFMVIYLLLVAAFLYTLKSITA